MTQDNLVQRKTLIASCIESEVESLAAGAMSRVFCTFSL